MTAIAIYAEQSCRWKVQGQCFHGWYDVKTSTEDGPYITETYASKQAARDEMRRMASQDVNIAYRVVPAVTKEDWSPYP